MTERCENAQDYSSERRGIASSQAHIRAAGTEETEIEVALAPRTKLRGLRRYEGDAACSENVRRAGRTPSVRSEGAVSDGEVENTTRKDNVQEEKKYSGTGGKCMMTVQGWLRMERKRSALCLVVFAERLTATEIQEIQAAIMDAASPRANSVRQGAKSTMIAYAKRVAAECAVCQGVLYL